jgi:hypothetical protein
MERTLESEIQVWKRYRYALGKSDTVAFDQIMHLVELNKDVASFPDAIAPFNPMLMSILLGQQKQILTLQRKIDALLVASQKQE